MVTLPGSDWQGELDVWPRECSGRFAHPRAVSLLLFTV